MNEICLKTYRALELNFKCKLPPLTKVEFEISYQYSVRYNKDKICVGTLICKLHDKTRPDDFYFNAELEGVFSFDDSVAREEIHVLSFRTLFPYLRSIVSSTTAVAGVAPVILPPADIGGQSIYRIDTEHLKP